MNLSDIQTLISNDEHRELELKKSTGELKDAMHSACAFLNTDGGWLVFGIAPTSLKMLGQEVTDNTRREIAQALAGIEPSVDVRVEYIDIPDRPGFQIIAMQFDAWVWGREPYTCNGRPFHRVESTTRAMPRAMYDERLRASKPHLFGWERQIADDFSIGDFDEECVMNAVRLGVRGGRLPESALALPVSDILQKLSLLKDGKPMQAAVALFSGKVHNYPQLLLRMARFEGVDKNVFLDNKRVSGNFFDLLDAGMSFCFKHLNLYGRVEGLQRVEHLEVPVEALREAMVNALCHRSFDSISGSVSLAIYDDRVEIENPGRLPAGVTPENIKLKHDSRPFNPLIAEILYKTSWLESWGSGVGRMVDACVQHHIPEPYYEIRPDGVAIIFKRVSKNQNDTTEKWPEKWPEKAMAIISLIESESGNVSVAQMETQLGIGHTTIKKILKAMQEAEMLRYEGPANGGHWEISKK